MIRRHRPAEKGWGRRRCRLPAAHCSGKRQHFEGWPLWWGQRCGRQPSGKGRQLPPSASGGCERSERVVAAGWALLPLPESLIGSTAAPPPGYLLQVQPLGREQPRNQGAQGPRSVFSRGPVVLSVTRHSSAKPLEITPTDRRRATCQQ